MLSSHLDLWILAAPPIDESGVEGVQSLDRRPKIGGPSAPALHGHSGLHGEQQKEEEAAAAAATAGTMAATDKI